MAMFIWNPLTACKAVLASVYAFSTMRSSSSPSIYLTLTPNFNASQHIISLLAVLAMQDTYRANAGDVLLEMTMAVGNVPSNDYSGANDLKATDDNGILPLTFNDADNGVRYWYSSRATHGRITAEFEALPRQLDDHTPVGPRVDLRMDQGGLIGAGYTFIPVPPNRDTIFNIHLNWNLSGAPEGTTAAWSFGDGVMSNKSGTVDVLTKTTYMVGPINKYTSNITPRYGMSEDFGVYWFGSPKAFDIQSCARDLEKLFGKMALFFEDKDESYRIFLRFNPYRGYGGTGFSRSFVLEYDPYVVIDEDDLLFLFTHEMVHNWPLLEQLSDGHSEEGSWYSEGIANYYARTLPFKFGLIDQQKLLQGINVEASAYYTNPSRGMSDDEANRRAWEDFEVQRLPYNRGALYLFDANAKIRDKSKGTRSIDESVLELLRRKENRQRYGLNEWLDMMVKELGPSGKEDWERMGNGELVIPVPNALGLDFELGRSDQEPFELGFSYTSLTSRIISGLIPGSRAAKAGLRDGDVLLRNDYLGNSADHYERNLNLVIRRDGREMVINYWPRKWEKVECWQWFDRSSLVATYESQYRLTHP